MDNFYSYIKVETLRYPVFDSIKLSYRKWHIDQMKWHIDQMKWFESTNL